MPKNSAGNRNRRMRPGRREDGDFDAAYGVVHELRVLQTGSGFRQPQRRAVQIPSFPITRLILIVVSATRPPWRRSGLLRPGFKDNHR
jgi:hypothetical protein